jgi:hypothetical protein
MRLLRFVPKLVTAVALIAASFGIAYSAGDLSRQEPIVVAVELGAPGQHVFAPNKLRFETGSCTSWS